MGRTIQWAIMRAIMGLALACVAGCAPEVAKDPHRFFKAAEEMRNHQDYEEAERLYLEALQALPDYAPAHRSLGSLYQDQLDQPVHALYHYERYREIERDRGTVVADTILPRIQSCKKRLLTEDLSLNILHQKLVQDRRDAQIELERARRETETTQQALDAMAAEKDKVFQRLVEAEQDIVRLQMAVDAATRSGSQLKANEAQKILSDLINVTTTEITSYAIQRGDTFSGIATRFRLTVDELKTLNSNPPINYNVLRLGQRIFVPKTAR